MSYGIFNLARMTVSSSGTGNITLNAAVSGYLTFDLAGCSTASTGQPVTYAINDTTQTEIARGTYYSSSVLLTRGSSQSGLKSTNSNSPINMSNTAQVTITPAANDLNNVFGQCRLSYTSSALITLIPYQGNKITVNYATETIPDAGVTFASTSLAASTLYYIYAYMSSGTMTLEASLTSHSAQAGTGVEIKTGDGSRTLVGMIYTSTTASSAPFTDSATSRLVKSWFNHQQKSLRGVFSALRSSTNASFVEINTEIRTNFLVWSGETVTAGLNTYPYSVAGTGVLTALTFDTTVDIAASQPIAAATGQPLAIVRTMSSAYGEGFHYATLYGAAQGGGTANWDFNANYVTAIWAAA